MSGDRPDETTLCGFRNGLLKKGLYEKLFKKLNPQLEGSGLIVKTGAIVDASRKPKKAIEVEEIEQEGGEAKLQANVIRIKGTGGARLRRLKTQLPF